MKSIKIILIGPSGIGKTTFRKIFFDQESPLALLNQTLEPTYGIESTVYDIGFTIAIHDLAGQQLEEWLTTCIDIFYDTDIVFCLLDCREDSEKNFQIYRKINDICIQSCPNAKLVIFLHKIDLISEPQRKFLQNYIDNEFPIGTNASIYLTSITEEFFFDLYRIFLQILNSTCYGMQQIRIADMTKVMAIMSWFSDHKILTREELSVQLKIHPLSIEGILNRLKTKGLINIDEITGNLTFNKSGYDILSKLKEKIRITTGGKPDEFQIIKAILISDQYGRTLVVIERQKDFFRKIMADPKAIGDPDLISMFFCAIRDFGNTFNEKGFNTIQIKSTGFQIINIINENISAIFFLDEKNSGIHILPTLRKYTMNFLTEHKNELDYFSKTGSLKPFETKIDSINTKIRLLNGELSNINQDKLNITRENLFKFYLKIDKLKLTMTETTNIKDLLMKYFVVGDNKILDEIYSILEKNNLKHLLIQ